MTERFNSYTADQIIDFLGGKNNISNNAGANSSGARLDNSEFLNLIHRINQLKEQFTLEQVGVVLKGLARINKNKDFPEMPLDIIGLTWNFDHDHTQEGFYHKITIIKACADLGYDKRQLSWNLEELSRQIAIKNITANKALVLLHSFAKLGYAADREEGYFVNTLVQITEKVRSEIRRFDIERVADFVHSLAKAKMFGKLFEMREELKSKLEGHYTTMPGKSAAALLQADLFCRCFNGRSFFDAREVEDLKSRHPQAVSNISKFQKSVERKMEELGYTILFREYLLDDPTRCVDMVCENAEGVYILEADGWGHFFRGKNGFCPNIETERRDEINKWAIALNPLVRERPCFYLTVPFFMLETLTQEVINRRKQRIRSLSEQDQEVKFSEEQEVKVEQDITTGGDRGQTIAVEAFEMEEKKEEEVQGQANTNSARKDKKGKAGRATKQQPQKRDLISEISRITSLTKEQQEALLKTAINDKNVEAVQGILRAQVVDLNSYVPETQLRFVDYALERLLNNPALKKHGNINNDLSIIEALAEFGLVSSFSDTQAVATPTPASVDSNGASARSAPAINGRALFDIAVEKRLYYAASYFISKFNITFNSTSFAAIVRNGAASLIANVSRGLSGSGGPDFCNEIWTMALTKSNAEEMAEELIRANILPTDMQLRSDALILGIDNQNEDIIRSFCDARFTMNRNYSARNRTEGIFPFLVAVAQGEEKLIDILMEGAEEEMTSDIKLTSLYVACRFGRENIVNRFITSPGDLLTNHPNSDWFSGTPLHVAAQFGHIEIIKILCEIAINHAADNPDFSNYHNVRNRKDEATPLHLAASTGREAAVRYLISIKAEIEARTLTKQATALHMAAQAGEVGAIRALVENGADVNSVAVQGLKPIYLAALALHVEACKYLVECEAVAKDIAGGEILLRSIVKEGARHTNDPEKMQRAREVLQTIQKVVRQQPPTCPSSSPATQDSATLQQNHGAERK